jgi:hypothetical protein
MSGLCPGAWGIVDNATFDHGGRMAELIAAAGCHLVALSPCCPDLNRIEKWWLGCEGPDSPTLTSISEFTGCDGSCTQASSVLSKLNTAILSIV